MADNNPGVEEGKWSLISAFVANLGIAVAKFVAFAITGSSSMLAEGIHSCVDSFNQILLALGAKNGRKAPDAKHPFGYGKAYFINAFLVAILLFSLGGVMSIYEGVTRVVSPEKHGNLIVAFIVVVVAILLEGNSLRISLKESAPLKRVGEGWLGFLKRTKRVNFISLILEDAAAVVGLIIAFLSLLLTLVTGSTFFDGLGSILIGCILLTVAIFMFSEVYSLLIGEGADSETLEVIESSILKVPEIDRIIDLKTTFIASNEMLVVIKVSLAPGLSMTTVATAIDMVEARVRQHLPYANRIYIEPDLYRNQAEQEVQDRQVQERLSDI